MSAILLFLLLFGQQSISSATLGGQVLDSSGAPLAGVPVSAVHVERNQSFEVQTDGSGRYRFLSLPIGDYRVQVKRPGFVPYDGTLTLALGQAGEVLITLNLGSVASTIEVVTRQEVLEATRTQVSEIIQPGEIDSLPLNGRNYLDLALLIPGVSRTNTGNNERFAETSAVPGTGISVAGQRNLGNTFIVDGLSADDDAAELAGTFLSPEVIREFQVVTSGGIAEYGRTYGGVVNVATQSGTNSTHGKVYGFLRNHRFDATNVFSVVDTATGRRIRSPLTQGQYGASVGMPLRADKAFLFSNFEREDLNRSGLITINPANVTAINTVLDRVGYPAPRVATGAYSTGDNRTNLFAKSDLHFGPKTRVAVRYNFYDLFSPNARNVGSLSAESRGTRVTTRDHNVAANVVTALSGTTLNELRVQFTRSRFGAPGNDLVGPAISISGVANFGASTSSPTQRNTDAVELADSYSVQRGSHLLKAGGAFILNRTNIEFPGSIYGTYSFSSLATFQSGAYTTFGQAFGKTEWLQTNPNFGWFVQDEWKPLRTLTINAGVRHDLQGLDASIEARKSNVAPRLGLAWAPGRSRIVVRSGFGVFFDRVPLRAVANALRGAGGEYKTISLQRTQAGAPTFPARLSGLPLGVLYNLATIDPHIRNAAGLQANTQVEAELTRGVSVTAGYLRVRGTHIIMNRNLNVPTLTAAQDPVNLGRPNPNFQNITQYSGQGDSYYNGMTLSFEQRRLAWAETRVSYTWSKAIDNTGNAFFSSPQNNFNIRDDRGLSDNDQRHRFTLSGRVGVPRSMTHSFPARLISGFQLNPLFTFATAYPFNIVTGGQTLQTTAARPVGVGRNTGKGFNSASLDLRLSRKLSLSEKLEVELIAESFNTLNRTNLQFPNNTFGTGTAPPATFGRATNAADPRQLQFGLRLTF